MFREKKSTQKYTLTSNIIKYNNTSLPYLHNTWICSKRESFCFIYTIEWLTVSFMLRTPDMINVSTRCDMCAQHNIRTNDIRTAKSLVESFHGNYWFNVAHVYVVRLQHKNLVCIYRRASYTRCIRVHDKHNIIVTIIIARATTAAIKKYRLTQTQSKHGVTHIHRINADVPSTQHTTYIPPV